MGIILKGRDEKGCKMDVDSIDKRRLASSIYVDIDNTHIFFKFEF